MRNVWFALALLACHPGSETAGRVELATENATVVIRDSQHVLELPLPATKDMRFETVDLEPGMFPGTALVANVEHGYLLGVWITRLGDKRPENIQRWFDDKLANIRGAAQIIENHGAMLPGNHPARFADFTVKSKGRTGRERLIGVDMPEHDLDLLLYAVVIADPPDATQLAWLDAIAADVKAIRIAPKP